MNKIGKIEIFGFWGDRNIVLNLDEDINFFIGANGSGKTTVINIIAAALTVDFLSLDKLPFDRVKIEFVEFEGRKKPSVEVQKIFDKNDHLETIQYKIKEKVSGIPETIKFDMPSRKIFSRKMFGYSALDLRKNLLKINGVDDNFLEGMAEVVWLSVYRSMPKESVADEHEKPSLDQKLELLQRDLSRFFFMLGMEFSEVMDEFQTYIISSSLTYQSKDRLLGEIVSLNIQDEEKALADISERLGLLNVLSNSQVSKHYKTLKKSLQKLNSKEDVDIDDLQVLMISYRTHGIIKRWNELKEKQEKILAPKKLFLEVLNVLMNRKEININDNNEIFATTDSGKMLSINELSSGEKQLFILLGEALLKHGRPCIYIADEPELSLHVTWQEGLIKNIKLINPEAQIICATHSPDIISVYSDNAIDMEEALKSAN